MILFFSYTSPTEIYTLSLHDALPISSLRDVHPVVNPVDASAIAEVPYATKADLDEALAASARAWPEWRSTDVEKRGDRKSTRLNSSHITISYAVFCLKKKNIL